MSQILIDQAPAAGFAPNAEPSARREPALPQVAARDLGDDIVFDTESVQAQAIREDNTSADIPVTMVARIGPAGCTLQIGVGFGDAVTPGATDGGLSDPAEGLSGPDAAGLSGLYRDRREISGHGDAE